MATWLIDVDYITNPENGKAIIRLWCKDENGVFPHYDYAFEPYFYVIDNHLTSKRLLEKVYTEKGSCPERVEKTTITMRDKSYEGYRVIAHHPSEVPIFKEIIRNEFDCKGKVLEADIPFAHRYLIDKKLACMDGIIIKDDSTVYRDPREGYPDMDIMAFDCEMLTDMGMADPEKNPIIVIGCQFNDEINIISGDNESKVLQSFFQYIRSCNPDIIVGYNQDSFDWPYVNYRASKNGLSVPIGRNGENMSCKNRPKIPGRMNVDLYNIVIRTIDDVKVKKLENIAEYFGNRLDFATITAKNIYECWTNNRKDEVFIYNNQDIQNTWNIASELLPMYYELSKMLRIPIDDVASSGKGKQVEWLLMSEANNRGEVIPNVTDAYTSYKGAFVLEPERGLHEKVACLDFACHPEDTLVIEKTLGLITIDKINDGDYVLGHDGWHRVLKSWCYDYTGTLININGLRCTPNHKIPVRVGACNKGFEISGLCKTANDLLVNDNDGKIIRCKAFSEMGNRIRTKQGLKTETEILKSEFVGIMLSDGYLLKKSAKYFCKERGKYRISHQHRVEVTTKDFEHDFRKRVEYIFKKLWGTEPCRINRNRANILSKIKNTLYTTRKDVYTDVEELMNQIDDLDAASIIRGFFEGDGSVNMTRKTIVMNKAKHNEEKLHVVSKLLRKLEINHSYYSYDYGKRSVCIIEIAGQANVQLFASLVGAISSKKSQQLEKILERNMITHNGYYQFEAVSPFIEHYSGKVYDLTLDKKPYYFANGVLTHNSMYPSIMITCNISPDTLVDESYAGEAIETPEVGHKFRTDKNGFFKEVVQGLITRRREIKAEMKSLHKSSSAYKLKDIQQWALKILANSFYGYMGWKHARWYCKEGAEAVTAWGRHFVKKSSDIASDMGFNVLYGDTDSVFVQYSPESTYDELYAIAQALASKLCEQLPIQIDLEAIYQSILFIEKKRYAGLTKEGSLNVKGLETRRGDWSELIKKLQKTVLMIILKDRDFEKAVSMVRDTVKDVNNGNISLENYIIHKSLTKRIQDYTSIQAHVKAAQIARQYGYLYPVGAKIPYVIVLNSRKKISDKAFPADIIEAFDGHNITDVENRSIKIDKQYYIYKQVIPGILRIVERFGYTEGDLSGIKQTKLDLW